MPDTGRFVNSLAMLAANCRTTAQLLQELGPERYATTTEGGGIGPHIRHCLDHLQALKPALDTANGLVPLIDYEQRRRGWQGETKLELAVNELLALAEHFEHHDTSIEVELSRPVIVRHVVDPDRPPAEDPSSLQRELHFCLSHSIHHQAILALVLKQLGIAVANDYGYAPSTLAAQKDTQQKQQSPAD